MPSEALILKRRGKNGLEGLNTNDSIIYRDGSTAYLAFIIRIPVNKDKTHTTDRAAAENHMYSAR